MAASQKNKTRKKMPLSQRAKIFAPFDPLPGFREELRAREEKVLNNVHDFDDFDEAP